MVVIRRLLGTVLLSVKPCMVSTDTGAQSLMVRVMLSHAGFSSDGPAWVKVSHWKLGRFRQ